MVLLQGSIPALITPMHSNREIDTDGYEKLIQGQLDAGVHGLVPMGTTAESPTLSHAEHKKMIEMCISITNKKVPVLAGTGSNSTQEAIELTTYAKLAGADACLVVVPYYNKPSQEGMYQHYKAIASAVDLPIVVYNIPGRTGVKMEAETFARLTKDMPDAFIGVKDATGDPNHTKEVLQAVNGDFVSLCGDDGLYGDFVANGSTGAISVTANLAVKDCVELNNALINKDMDTFNSIQNRLMDLHNELFVEPNPSPVKYAMNKLGMIDSDEVRLPMVKVNFDSKEKIDNALKKAGLL